MVAYVMEGLKMGGLGSSPSQLIWEYYFKKGVFLRSKPKKCGLLGGPGQKAVSFRADQAEKWGGGEGALYRSTYPYWPNMGVPPAGMQDGRSNE